MKVSKLALKGVQEKALHYQQQLLQSRIVICDNNNDKMFQTRLRAYINAMSKGVPSKTIAKIKGGTTESLDKNNY